MTTHPTLSGSDAADILDTILIVTECLTSSDVLCSLLLAHVNTPVSRLPQDNAEKELGFKFVATQCRRQQLTNDYQLC